MAKYFVSYRFKLTRGSDWDFGNIGIDEPIISGVGDVTDIERRIKTMTSNYSVLVTGWQKFEEVKPEISWDACDPELIGIAVIALAGPHNSLADQMYGISIAVEDRTGWTRSEAWEWLNKWQHLFCQYPIFNV